MEKALSEVNWMLLAPELMIIAAATLLSIADLLLKQRFSRRFFGVLSLIAIAWSGFYVLWLFGESERILAGTFVIDSFASLAKILLLLGVFFVILLSLAPKKGPTTNDEGEYYTLLLMATLGGMVMVSSADLITLFVGLELLSIASYILVGMRKKRLASVEAAWKYVVFGSVSSAFILYGMSFLYGVTGSTNLYTIQNEIFQVAQNGYSLYLYLSLFLMMFGFGFKIASAPFHTWAPDVYQGAETPITSFLSVVSKTAAFVFVLRILVAYLPLVQIGEWEILIQPLLLLLAALSMIVGNTVALRQTNAKRLMAYSGIAQMGYLLVPLATLGDFFLESTFYYLIAYLFMTMGAFAILLLVSQSENSDEISAFAGLSDRSPVLSFAMSLILISLAGLPITAGFLGKFYILTNAIQEPSSYGWLAVIMVITTVISYFYYFRFIRQMYFRQSDRNHPLLIPWPVGLAIGLSLVGTIGLAVAPDWILEVLGDMQWFGTDG